jgi:GT2 family glycosyltransferase
MFDLSIVIPTVNRAELLDRNLAALRDGVACSHEIIVVDGASDDETPNVLKHAKEYLGDRLTVIREKQREGFVRAANKGFQAAVGRNLMWLNDDSIPAAGALDEAVAQIDVADANVAFLAMFHHWHSTKNIAYETVHNGRFYRLCHVRGTLYANFPIGRRVTFEKLGWFDERYFLYAADPDLSLKAWHAGMRVEPAYNVIIEHDQLEDSRRLLDIEKGREDNDKLLAKWDLPLKNPWHNDFDPANPCTLRGLRTVSIAAAA